MKTTRQKLLFHMAFLAVVIVLIAAAYWWGPGFPTLLVAWWWIYVSYRNNRISREVDRGDAVTPITPPTGSSSSRLL